MSKFSEIVSCTFEELKKSSERFHTFHQKNNKARVRSGPLVPGKLYSILKSPLQETNNNIFIYLEPLKRKHLKDFGYEDLSDENISELEIFLAGTGEKVLIHKLTTPYLVESNPKNKNDSKSK